METTAKVLESLTRRQKEYLESIETGTRCVCEVCDADALNGYCASCGKCIECCDCDFDGKQPVYPVTDIEREIRDGTTRLCERCKKNLKNGFCGHCGNCPSCCDCEEGEEHHMKPKPKPKPKPKTAPKKFETVSESAMKGSQDMTTTTRIGSLTDAMAAKNKTAATAAVRSEVGLALVHKALEAIQDQFPELAGKYMNHPLAGLFIANLFFTIAYQYLPDNPKLQTVADVMVEGAMGEFIGKFDLEGMLNKFLKGVPNINTVIKEGQTTGPVSAE